MNEKLLAEIERLKREVERLKTGEGGGGGRHWQSWTPTFTGFSGTPTYTARYCLIGSTCFVAINVQGISNANNFQISLPYAAEERVDFVMAYAFSVSSYIYTAAGYVNAGTDYVIIRVDASSSSATSWPTSGNKRARFQMFYEVE